jgi:5-methylcytosine-specific restriction endonuclease McrA
MATDDHHTTTSTKQPKQSGAERQRAYRARKARREALLEEAKDDPKFAWELAEADNAPPPSAKKCRICGEEKPLDEEHFHVREPSRDGFRNECRECFRKKQEKYNRSEERKLARYERESKLRRDDPEWAERQRIHVRDWVARRPAEQRREYDAQPHAKERKAREHRAWVQANPDKHLQNYHKRRAREYGAEGTYTPDDLTRIMDEQGCVCFYCDESILLEWTIEHFIPLSRGGTNWPSNIRLACKACNSAKHDKLPEEFTPKVRRY